MWLKKEQKRVCGGNCSGGNIGVVPERGKGTAPIPKPQPKTLGDELREMVKESQNRISNKAATEAQIIFDVISKDFVKQSQDGYSSVYYNDKEFEDIMTNNHIANSKHVWKELKKICERNKIHAYLDDGIYPITYYYCFEWK